MRDTTMNYEQTARPPVSIATYAAITATLMIMVLSAITFVLTAEDAPARPAYDPTVSLIGLTDTD